MQLKLSIVLAFGIFASFIIVLLFLLNSVLFSVLSFIYF